MQYISDVRDHAVAMAMAMFPFQFLSVRVRVVPAGKSYSKPQMAGPAIGAQSQPCMHRRLCHQDCNRELRALFTRVSHPEQVWVRLQEREQRALLEFGL